MKKIGKQVLMLSTGKENPRNGEGSFLRLNDGKIIYAYTQYFGDDWVDHATARIAYCYSDDDGESWIDGGTLLEKPDEALNIMSVSLLRMGNGDLGLFYLQKEMRDGTIYCNPVLRRSKDEGKSFCEATYPIPELGYYVLNNDRVIMTKSGRIVFTVAEHRKSSPNSVAAGVVRVFYSDDDGVSFKESTSDVRSPYQDYTQLQEPGLFELPDGRLWMYIRTGYGCQYQSLSEDGGEGWSAPIPNWRFTSPDSPMLAKNVGKYTLAIFNPIPFSPVNTRTEVWGSPKRTPFVCAVSTDGGLSFVDMSFNSRNGDYKSFVDNCYYLEDDLENSYCYPAVIEVKNGFLVAYYHSDDTDVCLNATKIVKVSFDEIG